MTIKVMGRRAWEGERDDEGYRSYTLQNLVRGEYTDGPANIMQASGLPTPGSAWNFGSDVDIWAFCKLKTSVKAHKQREGAKHRYWIVTNYFNSKPTIQSCKDQQIEDPLLQPQKVSGSFVKYTEEKTHDRFLNPLKNSAHEQIRGPQVEFDSNRWQIRIEQNVAVLDLPLVDALKDRVNDAPLWGMPRRCVKFSDFQWEVNFYGTCYKYYKRTLTFDINGETFDRTLLDEGTKVLNGHWSTNGTWVVDAVGEDLGVPVEANPHNPAHFIRFKDKQGENARVMLNGAGVPAEVAVGTGSDTEESDIGTLLVEYYGEGNLLLLGIPTTF